MKRGNDTLALGGSRADTNSSMATLVGFGILLIILVFFASANLMNIHNYILDILSKTNFVTCV